MNQLATRKTPRLSIDIEGVTVVTLHGENWNYDSRQKLAKMANGFGKVSYNSSHPSIAIVKGIFTERRVRQVLGQGKRFGIQTFKSDQLGIPWNPTFG